MDTGNAVQKRANDFTISALREILKNRGLATARAKDELIARLMDDDPTGD